MLVGCNRIHRFEEGQVKVAVESPQAKNCRDISKKTQRSWRRNGWWIKCWKCISSWLGTSLAFIRSSTRLSSNGPIRRTGTSSSGTAVSRSVLGIGSWRWRWRWWQWKRIWWRSKWRSRWRSRWRGERLARFARRRSRWIRWILWWIGRLWKHRGAKC